MVRGRRIVPDFMAENPNDVFKLLLPLKLHLDEDSHGNSHFKVAIKNLTKKEVFTYHLSPELLFTHFPLEKTFCNGELAKYQNNQILDMNFYLMPSNSQKIKLHDVLDEKSIVSLIGWKRNCLREATYINCHLFEYENKKIIIPDTAIALYYYFRFSEMREAALNCTLEELYVMCSPEKDDAIIVLNKNRQDEDAAFIHRYACQPTANSEFNNIGKYILNYLNYMKNKDEDKEVEDLYIKANFPVKDSFKIETRCTLLTNEETHEKFYFVHEITNDYSNIGFNKLTKIVQQNKIISSSEELEDLPVINRDMYSDISEILKTYHASKKNVATYHKKDKKKSCGSLLNINIENSEMKKDTIIDIFKIYQEQENTDTVDQSLTDSSSNSKKGINKVIISSEFKREVEENKPLNEIDNFIVFKQYTDYLQEQSFIKNLQISEVLYLPEMTNKITDEINKKGKMRGRQRQYLTATFKYKDTYVGLLELENYPSSAAASWIILSKTTPISSQAFNSFITLFLEDNYSTNNLKDNYKRPPLVFRTKNHERDENLTDNQLKKWYLGLLGKIHLN